ncbi:MAG: hypothetical protein ABH864_04355 [archaeon]
MQLEIYSSGTVEVNQRSFYSRELRRRIPELSGKVKTPVLSFLLRVSGQNILVGAGISDEHPLGRDCLGRVFNRWYQVRVSSSIGDQLRGFGVDRVDAIVLKTLQRPEISGLLSFSGLSDGNVYAPVEEIEAVRKSMKRFSKERAVYSPLARDLVCGNKIRSLEELSVNDVNLIDLPGKSCGNQVGVRIGNVALVGIAMETPYSLIDSKPPVFSFREVSSAQSETLQSLRDLAKQGVLLLASYDQGIEPTKPGENFFESKQYERLIVRQNEILAQGV